MNCTSKLIEMEHFNPICQSTIGTVSFKQVCGCNLHGLGANPKGAVARDCV